MQIKEKVHIAGSVIPIQEHGFALAKFECAEMRFEFGTINNYKECAANVHAVKNTT